jgi:diguanylate cyclase (GGDEF)-like protein
MVAGRIRAATASHAMPQAVGRVTVSIGIALWPSDDADIDKVMAKADEALYRAKNAGRDRVEVWSAGSPQA